MLEVEDVKDVACPVDDMKVLREFCSDGVERRKGLMKVLYCTSSCATAVFTIYMHLILM